MAAPILEPTEPNLAIAAHRIRDGGVIIVPTDTNFALAIDPWNDAAVERVYRIKNRPSTSPLSLFVHDPEDWRGYAARSDDPLAQTLIDAFWPGPLNIIMPKNDRVPSAMVRDGPTVAIGCIANTTLRGLIRHFGKPVALTSANLSGQADGVVVDMDLAIAQIGDRVDCILAAGPSGATRSSTIVDISGPPRILRHGEITAEQLKLVAPVFAR